MKDKKSKLTLFLLFLLAYSSAYFCRLNFSAAMPEIIKSAVFNTEQLSVISSVFFFAYGAGQFLNGYLGDRVSPKMMLFIGLIGSGLSNALITFFLSYGMVTVLWCLNGFFQSMLWPPIIYMISKYYSDKEKAKCIKWFSLAVPIGTLLSYGINLLIIECLGWKYVFVGCGAILLIIGLIWIIFSDSLINGLSENSMLASNVKPKMVQSQSFWKSFIVSGLVIILLPVAIHGALKDSVTNWVPTFISEMFSSTTSLSLILTMILPIVNATGGFIAVTINNKLKNEVFSSSIFFTVALIVSLILMFFGKDSLILSVICLSVITNCMFAVNLLLISLMPLRFAKYNKVSFVSGALNSIAYLGCGLVNMFIGFILPRFSWSGVMLFWVILCVISIVVVIFSGIMWTKYIKKEEVENAIK